MGLNISLRTEWHTSLKALRLTKLVSHNGNKINPILDVIALIYFLLDFELYNVLKQCYAFLKHRMILPIICSSKSFFNLFISGKLFFVRKFLFFSKNVFVSLTTASTMAGRGI